MNKHGNYARHAQYWDWSSLDHDRIPSDEADYKYAKQYGDSILIPMCAWGHLGAYMAQRGMNVTAFDIAPEMIAEGKKRFGDIANLNLFVGDVRDFRFDIDPVDVCAFADWGHIHSLEDLKKALACINEHLRDGGCLLLGEYIGAHDDESGVQTFRVENNPYPDRVVYKTTNKSRNEAATRRWYCSQTVYIEYNDGRKEQFEHEFYMQGYTREEWLEALHECGFDVKAEYKNREKEPWSEGDGYWVAEAVKSAKLNLKHIRINLETDREYILERHCQIAYACDVPWATKMAYEEYRANWFNWDGQKEGFLGDLVESMKDGRTIAEIIKTEAGENIGFFWVYFHGEDPNFIWAEVKDIYVEQAYRRAGVAAYLMDYAEKTMKAHGAKVIRSSTGCENIKSQGLHEKIGYYQYRMEYEKILQEDMKNG